MFLVMGEEIAWKVDKNKMNTTETLAVYHDGFLSSASMKLIHRLTHEYYSSYKNVVKLFVPGEIADLFKKQISTKKKIEQSLTIYPDVRTMENRVDSEETTNKSVAVLNGTSTQQQKDKAWR